MHGIQIRVRLAGCGRYEHASSFELRDQVPHIGDVIEVPLADRMVRAQVVSASPPICRGEDIVTYLSMLRKAYRGKHNNSARMLTAD
jgi:hypothetical protein